MAVADPHTTRRQRLAGSHLYLVCGASPVGGALPDVLSAAIAGGVEIFQLREKHLPDAELLAAAAEAKAICHRLGALFVLNDRPDLARDVGADGIHVGQEDMPVGEVRDIVGRDMLIGLSTHAPQEIDAVDSSLVDYIGVGPVHATPTKLGRPAVGLELVRYAAARAQVPFFAIGGLNGDNIGETLNAGATRVCVLRAVADAASATEAAHALSSAITVHDDLGAHAE